MHGGVLTNLEGTGLNDDDRGSSTFHLQKRHPYLMKFWHGIHSSNAMISASSAEANPTAGGFPREQALDHNTGSILLGAIFFARDRLTHLRSGISEPCSDWRGHRSHGIVASHVRLLSKLTLFGAPDMGKTAPGPPLPRSPGGGATVTKVTSPQWHRLLKRRAWG